MLNRLKELKNDINIFNYEHQNSRIYDENQERELETKYLNENLKIDRTIAQGIFQEVKDNGKLSNNYFHYIIIIIMIKDYK